MNLPYPHPLPPPFPPGARRLVNVCVGKAEGRESGKYYSGGQQVPSSPDSYDTARADELWRISLEATQVEKYLP